MSEDRLPRVCVLMSLYNGTPFLAEQLESIAGQAGVEIFLLARDDGSADATPELFESECARLGIAGRLTRGANAGPAKSFLKLLDEAPDDFDGYAFSDQDDFWVSDKLARAMARLAERDDVPALYCTRHYVTDGALNVVAESERFTRTGFGNALVQNIMCGAGCAMNAKALRLARSVERPDQLVMHDWWLYLLVSSAGAIIYDDEPKFYYRQHGGNAIGADMAGWQKWKKRIAGHVSSRKVRASDQARALLEASGSALRDEDRRLARKFVAARGHPARRLALAFNPAIWRQSRLDDLLMRLLILLGRY